MQIRKQQLELDMEQQTGSKEEKEYIKTVYCDPAYLTYMQSTSWEIPDWMNRKDEIVFVVWAFVCCTARAWLQLT